LGKYSIFALLISSVQFKYDKHKVEKSMYPFGNINNKKLPCKKKKLNLFEDDIILKITIYITWEVLSLDIDN